MTLRRETPTLTSVINAQHISGRILEVCFPPQPGLIRWLALKLESLAFELVDSLIYVINLEINYHLGGVRPCFDLVKRKSRAGCCLETRVAWRTINNLIKSQSNIKLHGLFIVPAWKCDLVEFHAALRRLSNVAYQSDTCECKKEIGFVRLPRLVKRHHDMFPVAGRFVQRNYRGRIGV